MINYKTGSSPTTGGLVGSDQLSNTTIINSFNKGNITNGYQHIGGVIGLVNNALTTKINNVYNLGEINETSYPQFSYEILTVINTPTINEDTFNIKNTYYPNKHSATNKEITGPIGMEENKMQEQSFVDILNNNLSKIDIASLKQELIANGLIDETYDLKLNIWKLGENGYPILNFN